MAKPVSVLAIMTAALVGGLLSGAAAQAPREGVADLTFCWGGSTHVMSPTSKDHFGTYGMTGTIRSNAENKLFDGSSFECLGTFEARGGTPRHTGYCVIVDRDGHRAFGRDVRTSETYTWEFLGGTGKYAGITGAGKSEWLGAFPVVRPGTLQGCARNVSSYRLGE